MKSLLFGAFMCFSMLNSFAQRSCGTEEYARINNHAQNTVLAKTSMHSRDTVPNEIINIPVVVHVIFNNAAQNISDEQVKSQLAVLNNDFRRLNVDAINTPDAFKAAAADTRIMFCLAQVDPQGRPTRGIVHRYTNKEYFMGDDGMKFSAAGGNDAWDTKRYLNIWVCNMFGRSLGYATMPGGPAEKDGVVINYDVFGTIGNLRSPFNLGRTATHEVAHWLGLKHIWGDVSCGSDDVDDTPRQLSYNYNCPSFPHTTSCSESALGDMFMNYMDFTNDACMNMFTNGQKKKMRALFTVGGARNSLLSSYVCDASLASGAPLPDDTLVVAKPAGSVRLYPIPARDHVYIESQDGFTIRHEVAHIYNATGAIVMKQVITSEKERINVSNLPPGIYFLKIGVGANRKVIRFVRS